MTTNDLIKQAEELAEYHLRYAAKISDGAGNEITAHDNHAIEFHEAQAFLIRRLLSLLPKEGEVHNRLLTVEFGYRRCEQGHNLEATLSEYKAMIEARPK